jgi:transposase
MNDQYESSFKAEAIRLALSSSQSIAKTARDLGIKEGTLYNWVSVAKSQSPTVTDEQGNKANLVEELNRLRKENARLREEREILKKATAFFAKESK